MRFVGALDPIFVLAIARKVLDHFVNTTRHKPTDCRVEGYKLSDLEFVRAHISVAQLFTQPSAFRFRANLVTQIPELLRSFKEPPFSLLALLSRSKWAYDKCAIGHWRPDPRR
jgi:hypothetical protein